MRTVLICHDGALLDQQGLAGWLRSFTELAGIVILRENSQRGWQRVKREVRRVGWFRFLDVVAFRLYYKFFLAKTDRDWESAELSRLIARFGPLPDSLPVLVTHSPNTPEAEAFIRDCRPDVMLARCKSLLKPAIFEIPTTGTFVMHPGLCPEYRNAHGGFWALANGRPDQVAMTLLKIDRGIDTGPVYGYYTYPFDAQNESHIVIQARTVLENLDLLREKLTEIHAGTARPLDTAGRASAEWGQPWLSRYFRWKAHARKTSSAMNLSTPIVASKRLVTDSR